MQKADGERERRKHPRFFIDLPLEYQAENDSCLNGGIIVNASEGGLLVESVKAIPLGAKLDASVFFPREFELADLKLMAKIAWKEPLLKKDWTGYQYGLSIVRLLDEDHSKLKKILNGQFNLDAIDMLFEERKELKPVLKDGLQIPGYKVLVVDDDEDVRRLLVKFLFQRGHQCLQAVDGMDALGIATTLGIDAIITDIAMPRMDGIALTKELFRRIPRLPIMVMTGQDNEYASSTAMAAGAREFIKKPFSLMDFAARFDEMMKDQQIEW